MSISISDESSDSLTLVTPEGNTTTATLTMEQFYVGGEWYIVINEKHLGTLVRDGVKTRKLYVLEENNQL